MTQGIPTLPDEVAKRVLHFFWLVDWSGSMSGIKIASLNQAIRESVPDVIKAMSTHPEVRILMRCIKFADKAEWHIGPTPVEIDHFIWNDLNTGGITSTASAINLLCDEIDVEKMPRRGFPPVCILISDGYCTELEDKYDSAINRLNSLPWGKKAVRLSIAIGDESDYDEEQLLKFTNHKEVGVLKAHNVSELVQFIKWASTAASVGASHGKSSEGNAEVNVILPSPPSQAVDISNSNEVF